MSLTDKHFKILGSALSFNKLLRWLGVCFSVCWEDYEAAEHTGLPLQCSVTDSSRKLGSTGILSWRVGGRRCLKTFPLLTLTKFTSTWHRRM